MNIKKILLYLRFWLDVLCGRSFPVKYTDCFYNLNVDSIPGISLIISDFDDTLTGFHGEINSEGISFIKLLKKRGMDFVVFSNCPSERKARLIAQMSKYGIEVVKKSTKPLPDEFVKIINDKNVSKTEVMMVGDRVFTDMYGAKLVGIQNLLLVKPYSEVVVGPKAKFIYRVFRALERKAVKITNLTTNGPDLPGKK